MPEGLRGALNRLALAIAQNSGQRANGLAMRFLSKRWMWLFVAGTMAGCQAYLPNGGVLSDQPIVALEQHPEILLVRPEGQNADLLARCLFIQHLLAEEKLTEARAWTIEALRLYPKEPDLYVMLAEIEGRFGRRRKALSLLAKAYKQNPDRLDIAKKLAGAYMAHGDFDSAFSLLKGIADKDPEDKKYSWP